MNQTILTIDAYLALLVVLINFVFAILILARTSRTAIYIIFFFICISNMFWDFGDFMVFLTGNQFWFYLSLIGSGMLPALMFHFINTLVSPERKNTPWVLIAYFFTGFLAFSPPLALFHPGLKQFVDSIYWNILYLVLLGPFILAGIAILFIAFKRAKSEDEKSRLRYILMAFIIGVLTGLTDLVQLFKIPIPPLGHLGCLVYSSILGMGVFKHLEAYDVIIQMRVKLKALSEMAAAISHEIRNPLSSIKGASNLIAKELNHSKCKEYQDIIAEEIDRLNNILTNFQDFTQPLKIEKELVSINGLIQKTVKLAEMGMLNIGIRLELSEDLPMVRTDASLIKQVVLNLIKNASEACDSGGELVIKTEIVSHFMKISLSDNGPSIPPEVLKRIFQPFFTTKKTGMGMGLTITQKIIEAHHGRIEVTNLLPKGAEFSIFLPV